MLFPKLHSGKCFFISQCFCVAKAFLSCVIFLLLFIVPPSSLEIQAADNKIIAIEAKSFGQDVIFIFYRDKNPNIILQHSGQNVSAKFNFPVNYKLLNSEKFTSFAGPVTLSNKNQTLSFNVSDDLVYQSVINGEKFDAIKFKSKSKEKENLALIGSANNVPGGIKYTPYGEDHFVFFDIDPQSSNVAAFVRGQYLWVVFDQQKILSFQEAGIFSAFEQVHSDSGTVVRFKFKNNNKYHIRLEKNNHNWQIILSHNKQHASGSQNIINFTVSDDKEKVVFTGNFGDNQIISFEDPELGDKIITIPVANNRTRIVGSLETPELTILPSITGLVAYLHSDEVTLNKQENQLEILSGSSLHTDSAIDINNFPGEASEYLKLPTLLPYLDKNLDILDFNTQKSYLISQAAMATEKRDILEKNLALARFFFIHGWYQESLEALLAIKSLCKEEYQDSLEARFLTAVCYTMLEENDKAKPEYDELLKYNDIKEVPEISLWYKYNEFALGANPGKIGFMDNLSKNIRLYSDDKYWMLAFAEIELALIDSDIKSIDKMLKELKAPIDYKYANSLKFYKAAWYKKKNQLNLSKQLYKELSKKDNDPFNHTRAEFDLVKLRLKEKEIKIEEAIAALERLRFDWRGDQLEYEILIQLAAYYRENHDIMNALRIYKYVQEAFDNKISNFYITSEMAKIFNDVFLEGGIGEQMDDFTIVALFYEFKELNPIGEQGDEVIISIAKRLVNLDLLENAADLLKHQVTYRLQGEKKIHNADNLAIILMMDKRPEEAIAVLNDTDAENTNFKEHQYRVRLKAKSLIDLAQYDKALDYLKDDDSEDAGILKKEAMFQGKKWSSYIDLVNRKLDVELEKIGTDAAAVQDILRLAIAYHILNLPESLQQLSSDIGDKNPTLKNIIDLLATSSKAIDYKNLDKSLNIDQMKLLLDKHKKELLGK